MNVHCLHCGHTIQLGDSYDAYEGPLRCSVCKQLMRVRIVGGHLCGMEPMSVAGAMSQSPAPAPTQVQAQAETRPVPEVAEHHP
jgi:hypothetical protein